MKQEKKIELTWNDIEKIVTEYFSEDGEETSFQLRVYISKKDDIFVEAIFTKEIE